MAGVKVGAGAQYTYAYDANGNIVRENKGGYTKYSYSYDEKGQLTGFSDADVYYDDAPSEYWYEYDDAGNLTSVYFGNSQDEERVALYQYSDSSWGDLLTSFNGQAITYDAIGNPLTYYDGSTFTWQNGRQLVSAVVDGKNISFEYNADGMRSAKVVDGVRTEYFYSDGILLRETQTDADGDLVYTVSFTYDESGRPFSAKFDGHTYYYVYDVYGNVNYVYNEAGTRVMRCTYTDPWNLDMRIQATGTGSAFNAVNPFLYKGYYYDADLDMYYCGSRYYDWETCRWINADDIAYLGAGGLTSYNLFAYCGNNPVMGYDPYGTFDFWGFAKGVGRIVTGIAAVAAGVAACVVGAPVAMIAVAAVTITAGVLTAVNGAADIQQSVTGNNFVRDTVFNGNQTAYDVYSGVTETVAAVGTAVCGNYLSTNCTMKGAVPGTEGKVTLEPGTTLDRYGNQYGRYLTDPGTSINQLALPPDNSCNLTTYVVNRPVTFRTGVVSQCKWGPGGGVQYFSWMSVQRLVQFGFLTPLG